MARTTVLTASERKEKTRQLQRARRQRFYAMGLTAVGLPKASSFKKTREPIMPQVKQPPQFKQKGKYDHLIDEPINEGCRYSEYRRRSEAKSRPLKRARLKVLREERKRRIALHGKIKIPKIKHRQWSGGRGTQHVE